MGHNNMADKLNEDIQFNDTQWTTPAQGNNLARIAGAGFENQDVINRARGDGAHSLVNGLHKLSYVARDRGDLKSIEKTKGRTAKSAAQAALFLSAVSDFHRAANPDRQWDVGYWQSNKGSPGLKLSMQF